MCRRPYLLIALLLTVTVVAQGCGQATPEVSTATPAPATEQPMPTATPEAAATTATEEPTREPTVTPEPSPTVTPQLQEPTATPEMEQPTATPEPISEPAEQEGQVLLQERCTACHDLARVERAQKSREEWVANVDRMVGYGAQVSESEQEVLVDYLVETYGP